MSPNKGPCVVFIEELAEKRSVQHSCLQPMSDSKWVLPHRFKRNRGNAAVTAYDLSRKISLRHPFHDKKPTAYKKHQKFGDIDTDLFDCAKEFDSRCENVDQFYDFGSYTDLSHFQPYSIDLVAMPLNTYYRSSNHNSGGGGNHGNANTNHNQKSQRQSPVQQQKNARNAQQAPKQSEHQVQLLKRDVNEEKDFQVMTPPPNVHQPHGSEHPVDVSIPPPPIPLQYGNNGGFVHYYYPSTECIDPNYYNVPAEMMASQPMYQVAPQAYAAAPIPIQAAAPYTVAPSMPPNQMYSLPVAGWPSPANSTSGCSMQLHAFTFKFLTFIQLQHIMCNRRAQRCQLVCRHCNHCRYVIENCFASMVASIWILRQVSRHLVQIYRVSFAFRFSHFERLLIRFWPTHSVNDKSTVRFFYNMGIEFFHNLQATYGLNQLLSMFENENCGADTSSIDYDSSAHQLSNDFQQMSFDTSEPDVLQTPHKERVLPPNVVISGVVCFLLSCCFFFLFVVVQMPRYHHEGYFPGPTVNQNRRPNPNHSNYRKDTVKPSNKPNPRYNSYSSSAPKQPMNKNGPKHYQYGGPNYDSTPTKDSNGKSQYESNTNHNSTHAGSASMSAKRDNPYATPDVSSTMPPPLAHPSYLSPYMSYVPYDGNAEHPPMYMPMNLIPSPGKQFDRRDEKCRFYQFFSLSWIRVFANSTAAADGPCSNANCVPVRSRSCRSFQSFASSRL